MAGNHKRRKRSIDINTLTADQADKLSEQIGKEIAKIMDAANENCNKLLKIYGLESSITYQIFKTEKKDKTQSL